MSLPSDYIKVGMLLYAVVARPSRLKHTGKNYPDKGVTKQAENHLLSSPSFLLMTPLCYHERRVSLSPRMAHPLAFAPVSIQQT
ncbi:MAG: hypothetical protein HS120_03045 [Burkholderiales bacterium]|nr:hypothetical protein [Burkholderiales bacterium]